MVPGDITGILNHAKAQWSHNLQHGIRIVTGVLMGVVQHTASFEASSAGSLNLADLGESNTFGKERIKKFFAQNAERQCLDLTFFSQVICILRPFLDIGEVKQILYKVIIWTAAIEAKDLNILSEVSGIDKNDGCSDPVAEGHVTPSADLQESPRYRELVMDEPSISKLLRKVNTQDKCRTSATRTSGDFLQQTWVQTGKVTRKD